MPEITAKSFEPKWEMPFQGAWCTGIAFLEGGNKLAAGNRKGELYLWDLAVEGEATPQPIRQLDGHTNGITRLVAAADGTTLVSASLDGTVCFWDTLAEATGKADVVMDQETREAEAKKARNDDALKRPGISVETMSPMHVVKEHKDWVNALGVSRDGKRLISGDDSGLVLVHEIGNRSEVARWQGYPGNWISSVALSTDGTKAFVGEFASKKGDFDRPPAQVRFWDVEKQAELVDVLKVQFPNVKVRDNSYGYSTTWGKFVARGLIAADFSPDGKLLAAAQGGETNSGQVHLIDTETGKLVRTVSGHQSGATDVRFSSDGSFVLSAGRDTTLRICQVEDGKEVAALGKSRGGQFKDWFYAIAATTDEEWLAASDISGQVHVWKHAKDEEKPVS